MWDYERITSGLVTMLWGMFLKLVITDRLSVLVDNETCEEGLWR